jgi:hypothetical protein
MCKFTVIYTILCSICFAQAQSVALSGVVKLSDGTPVEGVTVSLAGLGSLSVLTKENGTFSLEGVISKVTSESSTPLSWHFTLQENSILFTPTDLNASLDVQVYTSDGRIITSRTILARSVGNNRVTLPLFGSGIYYIAVKTGEMEIIRPLLHVGKKLYCENGTLAPVGSGRVPAANKKAAGSVVDTLIAEKDGYNTAKLPLTSYEQDEIEVILEPETGFADVIAVAVTGEENDYTFDVTLETSDIDCSHFANWFEVLTDSGELVYRRILVHPHTDAFSGNPYTRGGGPVPITSDQEVIVRGHLNDLGYVGMAMRGRVDSGFENAPDITAAFTPDVASEPPQPEECIPEETIFGQ